MDACNEKESANTPQLCANGCGFYGTKATKNLCSRCFFNEAKEYEKVETNNNVLLSRKDGDSNVAASAMCSDDEKNNKKMLCSCCSKRIRQLMIFDCRCGGTFCMKHRFPEDHSCAFDFKDHGDRLVFALDNLLVKADKLDHRI